MNRALGEPHNDPHGHPIPSGWEDLAQIAGHPLSACASGTSGRVGMVADDRPDLLSSMARTGIVPQQSVTVVGRTPGTVSVDVGGRVLTVPVEVAQRVFVVGLSIPPAADAGRAVSTKGQTS